MLRRASAATFLGIRRLATSRGTGSQSTRVNTVAIATGLGFAAASVTAAACSWYNPLTWFGGSADWAGVRSDIEDIINNAQVDGEMPAPVLLRLAWHCSGTYDAATGTGGSNGATMRFPLEAGDGANAGLDKARALLESVKAKHPNISYADLYTFAGKVAVESMGGPEINWKPGRTDTTDETLCPPNGRLPDAAQGADHIRQVFYRMGFNDQEIVALAGAHTVGRCHTDRSGFEGPWAHDVYGFDNEYFTLLLEERWTIRPNFQPLQYEDSSKQLMMLPADIALIQDPKFRQWVVKYAEDMDLFHRDFAAAFAKLIDLGVPRN